MAIEIYVKWRVSKNIIHFTIVEGAQGIAASGMRAGGGLFGRGVYATKVGRPWNYFVPSGSLTPIPVNGNLTRIIPLLVYLEGGSTITAGWGVAATLGLDRITSECGC